jgi:demethylmenaquinone methyltransferase/2-methoxy-6-polyprenyl-1,4-benzoquinol methylase
MRNDSRESVHWAAPPPMGKDAKAVQQMFAKVADRYDFLNHLLSLSVDRYWRRRAVNLLESLEPAPEDACLDLCTGTGDMLFEVVRRLRLAAVGSDFCHPMLLKASRKHQERALGSRVSLIGADAETLPFRNSSFRFVTVAFGIRNVETLERGLFEIVRVLKPGGTAIILEFSTPVVPLFRNLFNFYFSYVLPKLGSWVSGTHGPYQYLPASVRRFPSQREFAGMLESSGLEEVHYRNLTLGIAALHWGQKPR